MLFPAGELTVGAEARGGASEAESRSADRDARDGTAIGGREWPATLARVAPAMHEIQWNTPCGPFGKNPDFDRELTPPLDLEWSVSLPRADAEDDSSRVGCGEFLAIGVGHRGVHVFDARSGALLGEFDGFRRDDESRAVYFALDRVWIQSFGRPDGELFSVIRRMSPRLSRALLPNAEICGVVATGGTSRIALRQGLFDPSGCGDFEPFPEGFDASIALDPRVFGSLGSPDAEGGGSRVGCFDAVTGQLRWRSALGSAARPTVSVVSGRYCAVLEGTRHETLTMHLVEDGTKAWTGPYSRGEDEPVGFLMGEPGFSRSFSERTDRAKVASCFLISDALSRLFYVEEKTLLCRDADSGEVLWSHEFPRDPQTRHLIGTGRYLWCAMVEATKGKGRLYCFDKESGDVVWKKDLPAKLRSVYLSLIGGRMQMVVGSKLCSLRSKVSG